MKKTLALIILVSALIFVGTSSYTLSQSSVEDIIVCSTNPESHYIPSGVCEYYLLNHRTSKDDIDSLESRSGIAFLFEIADADKRYSYTQAFIDKGADVNKVSTIDGYPPLHAAVITNDAKLVELLIKHGANIQEKDKNNQQTAKELLHKLTQKNPSIDRSAVSVLFERY